MTDTNAFIRTAANFQPLMEPTVRAAIRALELPPGSHGLDAGCGTGLQSLLLAEAVGPGGHVTGVDISPAFLRHAEEWVQASSSAEQVSFCQGDVRHLPFDDGTFDWAWSACCVGYAASIEPLPAVVELARVVKPGGTVAIYAWSSETLLPGYPLLEAHLDATTPGLAPFVAGNDPRLHFLRALGWLREAGLQHVKARTFVGEAAAPLSDELRRALVELFAMRWPGAEAELAEEDRAAYGRLCLPESPQFIVDEPDYYAFFTCSMFWGKVAKGV
jgi:demethylmenaquinone methyltransferase/2-methoxy-6-polyprenyl-1,4-benzoquinol methylase